MKYLLDIEDNKTNFAEEFFKTISFVKNVRAIPSNEITDQAILKSINEYETGKTKPAPLNLAELKVFLNA